LWIGTFVNRVGAFVAPFLALYLTGDRHLSIEQAGLIVSLQGLGSIGAGPVGGALADRVGRRPVLGLTCVLGAAAMLALGAARSLQAIGAAAIVLGFFGEMYRPAANAIVADVVPSEDRPRAYGLLYWAVNLGFSIAPLVAGFVATRSFSTLFVADAATTLLFGGLVVAMIPETLPTRAAKGERRLPTWTPYKDGLFVTFIALSTLLSLVFFQRHVALAVHLRAHGLPPHLYGALFALNGILIVVFQPFAARALAGARHGRVLAASAVLVGFGFGMTELGGSSLAMYALSLVVWTAGEIAMAPIGPSAIADLAPPELRGAYQGAFQITFGAGAFLAPVLGSFIMERAGSGALWGSCAGMGLVVAIGHLAIAGRIERRAKAMQARSAPAGSLSDRPSSR
jgi:MFS family permease